MKKNKIFVACDTTNIKKIKKIITHTKNLKFKTMKKSKFHENTLLQLNSSKSEKLLNWSSVLSIKESILFTYSWYENYFINKKNNLQFSEHQILEYCKICKSNKKAWSK